MSKATIVWFSDAGKPYRVISLRKGMLSLFLGIGIFLMLLALVLTVLTWSYRSSAVSYQEENTHLHNRLAEQKDRIQSLEDSVAKRKDSLQDLRSKLKESQKEMEQIREMEIKLRQFLGLEHSDGVTGKKTHRGGLASPDSGMAKNSTAGNATSQARSPEIVSYSLSLKESLRQVVRALDDKKQRLRHTPSILPVKGEDVWLACDFGRRKNPFTDRREFHTGLDVAGGYKTPLVAPAAGRVYQTQKTRILGKSVRIRHREDMRTTYGHLHSIAVEEGERVERGDVIGYMGNSGRSTGTHVHYEVVKQGEAVDPWNYILDRQNQTLSLR